MEIIYVKSRLSERDREEACEFWYNRNLISPLWSLLHDNWKSFREKDIDSSFEILFLIYCVSCIVNFCYNYYLRRGLRYLRNLNLMKKLYLFFYDAILRRMGRIGKFVNL